MRDFGGGERMWAKSPSQQQIIHKLMCVFAESSSSAADSYDNMKLILMVYGKFSRILEEQTRSFKVINMGFSNT